LIDCITHCVTERAELYFLGIKIVQCSIISQGLNIGRINCRKKKKSRKEKRKRRYCKRIKLNQEYKTLLSDISLKISAKNLSQIIDSPLDNAISTFVYESSTVASHFKFFNATTKFYVHLLNQTGMIPDDNDKGSYDVDAYDLLKRAASNNEGLTAYYLESLHGQKGGLRFIFNEMVERLKIELSGKYIRKVFKESLDPLDWSTRVGIIEILMHRLKPWLSEEILSQPAYRYATDYEMIISTYVKSIDSFQSKLKTI
jgi:hypothetical protein